MTLREVNKLAIFYKSIRESRYENVQLWEKGSYKNRKTDGLKDVYSSNGQLEKKLIDLRKEIILFFSSILPSQGTSHFGGGAAGRHEVQELGGANR